MAKLHQILAVEAGIRNQSQKDLTEAHHGIQKAEMLQGVHREYQPVSDAGEQIAPERQLLQTRVPEVIRRTVEILERTFDVIATRDFANMIAKADVVLEDGTKLATGVPAPYLLWMEKRLDDLHTFVTKLPTLPADTEWEWEPNQNCFKNKHKIETVKTAKIAYPLVLHPGTDKHPAQVVEKARDETVGHWTTHKYSGAIPTVTRNEMKAKVEALQKAVKFAREKANEVDVTDQKIGGPILKYIFGEFLA
jgi:hypothetical protein